VGDLTPVGSYTGSASPYGTFDQGGNVFQWTDEIISAALVRDYQGGSFGSPPVFLEKTAGFGGSADLGGAEIGFRLALIPEPGTGLLVITGLFGLAGWRRARA
jgi:formylglycine-generating enzyme required for sulfatase activity